MTHHILPVSSPLRTPNIATAAVIASLAALLPATAIAQAALGTPFIGGNVLSFQFAQATRNAGPTTTTTFGVLFGHRFGSSDAHSNVNVVVRASARPLEGVDTGVLDFAATVGVSQKVGGLPNLSVAASTGLGLMAWNDDAAKSGRAQISIPANAGVSYAVKLGYATIAPFAMGTVARYDQRNSVNDVEQSKDKGWDTHYTTGASLRLKEVVLTSSRIVGEHGMSTRSRWTFSAGVSF